MKPLLAVRLALGLIGVIVWGYGYYANLERVRLAGIIVMAITLVMRFVARRASAPADAPPLDDGGPER